MRKELPARGLEPLNHETRAAIRLPVLVKAFIGVVRVETVLPLRREHGDTTRHFVLKTRGLGATAFSRFTTRACGSRPGARCGAGAKA